MTHEDYYSFNEYSNHDRDGGGYRRRRRTSKLTFFVIGMVLFILVFMPFYGITLRYYIGTSFRLVFDYLGNVFQTIGGVIFLYVGLKLFFYRKISFGGITGGFVLLYMGAFLTGGTVVIFGMTLFQPRTLPGFH